MESIADAGVFLESEAASGQFRGAVLAARGEDVLLRAGYGLANEEWGIPNTPTTKFRIGSVTKTFTAAAVLKLAEAAGVDLNAPIGRVLEDLPEPWKPLTLHQLLTHTSGLKDHALTPAKRAFNRTGARPEDLIRLIATEPLLSPPGIGFAYSNTGYFLLGLWIERVSGKRFAEYVEGEILRPLGLGATGYDSHLQILPGRASGYALTGAELQNADFLDMTVPYAAGGLYSTVDDLLRWNRALHEEGFLLRATYERMVTRYPESETKGVFYGYGLFLSGSGRQTSFAHSGGVNGFIAMMQYYPEVRGSLIVLSNLPNPLALQRAVQRLSATLTGDQP